MQKKSERLFRIFNRLKTTPQSAEELHHWCKSHNIPAGLRTIYRYIDELTNTGRENGFEVVTVGKGSRDMKWKVVPAPESIPTTRLGDAIKGFQIMTQLSGVHVRSIGLDYLQQLSDNLIDSAINHDLGSIDLINHLIVTGWGQARYGDRDRRILKSVLKAIEEKRMVVLEFLPQMQAENPLPNKRLWKPHALVSHRGSIFVTCTKDSNPTLYFFDLESIIAIKLSEGKFRKQIPKDEVEAFLSGRFGITSSNGKTYKVRLAFHPSDSKSITGFKNPFIQKRSWHPKQQFMMDESGKYIVLEFDSQLNRELVGWVMMWMDHVKILDPPELKHLVSEKLESMRRILEGADPMYSTPASF